MADKIDTKKYLISPEDIRKRQNTNKETREKQIARWQASI